MGPVEITGKACASTQKNRHRNVKELDWKARYGLGKGLWKMRRRRTMLIV
jgi:hypothetical protein